MSRWLTAIGALVAAFATSGCEKPNSPPIEDPMSSTKENKSDGGSANDCVSGLRGLASGDLTAWHGLTESCTSSDVIAALGAERGADQTGSLGGSPTRFRIYKANETANEVAPHGIYVWDVEDKVVLVRAHQLKLSKTAVSQLGEPDAKEISKMPGFKTQWIYASRGLTLHIDDNTGEVAYLYGYAPMSVEDFKSSWLAEVEMRRTPAR